MDTSEIPAPIPAEILKTMEEAEKRPARRWTAGARRIASFTAFKTWPWTSFARCGTTDEIRHRLLHGFEMGHRLHPGAATRTLNGKRHQRIIPSITLPVESGSGRLS